MNAENQREYNNDHTDYAEYDDETILFQRYPTFHLEPLGRGFVITMEEPSECDFYGEPLIYLTQDAEKGPAAVWDDSKKGWLVNRRDHDAACCFVNTH